MIYFLRLDINTHKLKRGFMRTKHTFALLACTLFSLFSSTCHAEEEGKKVPTDFMRDVMMPIGIPVVSSFHTMRESQFLNTKLETTNPIEAIGDFFLAPSQYLFACKKIILKRS